MSRRQYAFYCCQLEAIETLIWHPEVLPEYRQDIFLKLTVTRLSGYATRWLRVVVLSSFVTQL